MEFIPAFVESWDGTTMRVMIDGYTDGADVGMRAEVIFPFSDRPDYTGFFIQKGDPVWVVFNNNDPNAPFVVGFRNINTGQNKDTRRFRHTNFEAHASQSMTLKSPTITIKGDVKIEGTVTTSSTIKASDDVVGGGISLMKHIHTESGGKKTKKPE